MTLICKTSLVVLTAGVLLLQDSVDAATEDENEIARGVDAKSILGSLAGNLMSRGYGASAAGGSQVVSLNLTNLLVLVLLKALIFAAGSLGAGAWKGGFARSNDGAEQILTEEEVLLYLSYLSGSPACLHKIACREPQQAKKYVAAGDMLLRATKMLSFDPDRNYEYVLKEVDQAAEIGIKGGDCSRFSCSPTDRQ